MSMFNDIRTIQNACGTLLRSPITLEIPRIVVGVFLVQEMKKKGTGPATTSQTRWERVSSNVNVEKRLFTSMPIR